MYNLLADNKFHTSEPLIKILRVKSHQTIATGDLVAPYHSLPGEH